MSKYRGGIGLSLILIIVVIALAVFLVGGFTFDQSKRNPTGGSFIPAETLPDIDKKSLQLKTIPFITFPPPPTTQDCGNGTLRGTPEPNIIWAISPDPGGYAGPGGSIKLWYTDEHALTLGAGAVSPISTSPDHVVNPNIGDDTQRDGNNFPFYPAIFLSDITNDPNNKSGDAENGGKPYKPDEVYGTWKSKGSRNSVPRNFKNLGSGADLFPNERNVNFPSRKGPEPGYGAEIIWRVNNLGLISGHSYRAEFIIHDGDSEGDIGQGCVTIKY